MGVTARTVLDLYVTEEQVRTWGATVGAQLRDAELVAHDPPEVLVDQRDGLTVLAAFGVCGTLAVSNLERRERCEPIIVLKDAADSTVEFALALYVAGEEPAQVGSMGIMVGRKVLGMTGSSVTRRTLDSALARERSISFCKLRTLRRSPAFDAAKMRCRKRRTSSSASRQLTASQSRACPAPQSDPSTRFGRSLTTNGASDTGSVPLRLPGFASGHEPSGGTGPPLHCQGCSRPHPQPGDRPALSFHRSLR